MTMDDLTLISKGLYRLTSDIIGAEPIVKMRRRAMGLYGNIDVLSSQFNKIFEETIFSGSMAEGFRFRSSDHDWMYVRRGIKVKFSLSQRSLSDNAGVLLLAETVSTRPGFVLLRLLSETIDPFLIRSCMQYGTRYYLSSSSWVRNGYFANEWSNSSPHGPCTSGNVGTAELDIAECLKSDTLPNISKQRLIKLHQAGHLTRAELENIVRNGCHFVAICSKNPVYEHLEWRTSFSLAEKSIIHSMNQTQFLCYGLLKIFLKEAIEVHTDIKGLLCSYFMKTALFWKLLDNQMLWRPENFVDCFWKCLEVLINWVDFEYCPNFFIPGNNMLAGKFTARQQSILLHHLRGLYSEGINCLLRCPSLNRNLTGIIQRPVLARQLPSDLDHVTKSLLDCHMVTEIWNKFTFPFDSDIMLKIMNYLEDILSRERQDLFIHLTLINGCRYEDFSRGELNKSHFNMGRTILISIKSSAVDATSHLVYMAVYLYRSKRYNETLQVITKVKSRLQKPSIMYKWRLSVNSYAAAGGETRSLLDMMKTIIVFPLEFTKHTCIPELYKEHVAAGCDLTEVIRISPLVCADFLLYLCHHHLSRFHSAKTALQELSTLLHYDNGHHIHKPDRAISWEILGVCQEMNGEYRGAYHSYSLALQEQLCHFQSAAKVRLKNVRRFCEI